MNPWLARDSETILVTLAVILAAAVGVFAMLGRRVTRRHQELVLRQWAYDRQAQLLERPFSSAIPGLDFLAQYHPSLRQVIHSAHWTLAELSTDPPAEAKGKTPRWRILAFRAAANWPGTGLRPVAHSVSFLDLFPVSSFPSLAVGDAFVLFGSYDSAASAAAELASSELHKSLPPDLGLLLIGDQLILDFSHRRFDSREFDGLLALAAQLAASLAATNPAANPS